MGERDELIRIAGLARVDLFHLERMASILDSPQCYGIRLEFLDIEMTKEEQLAFFWTLTSAMDRWRDQVNEILEAISKAGILSDAVSSEGIVKLQRSLTSMSDFPLMRLSISLQRTTEELAAFQNKLATTSDIPLMRLSIALQRTTEELAAFQNKLATTSDIPLMRLSIALQQITETLDSFQNKLHSLSSDELREYEIELDRILTKLERVQKKSLTQ